jgi:hypothetical protein
MVVGNLCIFSNVHNTSIDLINLQFWRCNYMGTPTKYICLSSTLYTALLVLGGGEVPCNLTQVVSNTLGSILSFGEIIIKFYESTQLHNGEPNTPGFSNTFSNYIPCVSNYLFIMGN